MERNPFSKNQTLQDLTEYIFRPHEVGIVSSYSNRIREIPSLNNRTASCSFAPYEGSR